MFSNLDSDDFASMGRIAGIALFAIAFLLPGVGEGPNCYYGWACAAWTLSGTASFIASIFGPDGPGGGGFFFMVSGWITPLVLFGIFINSDKVKRGVAKALPILLVVHWIVFGWPDSGWGATGIHPRVGHYIWTVGCLLIFTPEYATILAATKKGKDSDTE